MRVLSHHKDHGLTLELTEAEAGAVLAGLRLYESYRQDPDPPGRFYMQKIETNYGRHVPLSETDLKAMTEQIAILFYKREA